MEEKDIGSHVIKLSNQLRRAIDRSIIPYGLTGAQARVIHYIYDHACIRDIYQKDIEEKFDIRRSSVTSMLQLLEKKGCIQRVSVAEDARLKRILLTERGVEVHNTVGSTIAQIESTFAETLSEEEKTQLIDMMKRLSQKIGSM